MLNDGVSFSGFLASVKL